MKAFKDLTEQEILALAISMEEEHSRTYADYAAALRKDYPSSGTFFDEMKEEEIEHRRRLSDLYKEKFGDHIPLIQRQHVKGFVTPKPVWLITQLGPDKARKEVAIAELQAQQFYDRASQKATDVSIRKLLSDLADAERQHTRKVDDLEAEHFAGTAHEEEQKTRRRLMVLQVVQPGLAGLMDGSVSTLAPVFAAAFATRSSHDAFVVGLAASIGAGISMGFAEALSDDGSLSGRGRPWIRGAVCGLMTTLGGIGHTLPYLVPHFMVATAIAVVVVIIELIAISYIRHKYMDTPLLAAAFQVIVGGVLVFIAGILIGSAG